jgi:glucosamine--fructose-6-phosphate aminotransferase (isomerizing)
MTLKPSRTVERDVQDQPEALAIVLDRMFGEGRADLESARATLLSGRPVVVTGMGASFHVAVPLTYHLSAMGIHSNLVETGELVRHRLPICRNAVVLVISQSGQTSETVELLDAMAELNAVTIGVTNEEPGALARRAHQRVIVGSPRDTIYAVQTYMGAMAALLALSGRPGLLERSDFDPALAAVRSLVEQPMEDGFPAGAGPVYTLARGPSVGSARAACLWLHQFAGISAVPMTGGIFRHGPIDAVSEGFQAIGFAPKDVDEELNLAADIRAAGGEVRLIGPGREWSYPSISPLLAPLVEIVPAQRAAIKAAHARGIAVGVSRAKI